MNNSNNSGIDKLCWSARESTKNYLTYNRTSHFLCYKSGDDSKKFITIYITWPDSGTDLDICTYFQDLPDKKFGWNWGNRVLNTDTHYIHWYGDNVRIGTNEDYIAGGEKIIIKLYPWHGNMSHVFNMHFNYYREAAE